MTKALKPFTLKKSSKHDRERKVLLGLVDYYLKTGKPVGSNTLKEAGFEDLSSATLRNYFATLEEEGYLHQQHTSGGRIPTDKAFRLYANYCLENEPPQLNQSLDTLGEMENKEIASFLQKVADHLSEASSCAVFLSAPRFDHDYVNELKLVSIDGSRCLGVIVTDFGVVQTELLPTDQKLTAFAVKRIEAFFQWRIQGGQKPEGLTAEEEKLAQTFYNELMVRYIVGYANFLNEDLYNTGFSKLLNYNDFQDPASLASSLGLFENPHSMRLMLRECAKHNSIKLWIGDDLTPFCPGKINCMVAAIPYCINSKPVGAIGILGPQRVPYRKVLGLLRAYADRVSLTLTKEIFKHKITFRQPQQDRTPFITHNENRLILIEDKRS